MYAEIDNRNEIKKVYPVQGIINAAARYYGLIEDDFITKKSKWNPGKRVLIIPSG